MIPLAAVISGVGVESELVVVEKFSEVGVDAVTPVIATDTNILDPRTRYRTKLG